MSLRQALEKLRNDIGKEAKENHLTDDDNISVDFVEFDFDLGNGFFEPDEYWDTSTPLQGTTESYCDASSNAKTDRIPLTQICDQTAVSGDKSFISSTDGLPVTSNSSSQKKLKSFAFSHSNRKEVSDSDGLLPPSKKLASEKDLSRLSSSQQMSFAHCSVPSTPNSTAQVNSYIETRTNTVSAGPSVMRNSTPMTTPSNKHNHGTPSLPVTPVSCRSAVKRKFPGPAGLLPKLLPNQSLDDVKLTVAVSPSFTPRSKVTTIVDLLPSSQGDCCDFSGTVWKSAMEDTSTQETCCISELLKGRQLRRDQKGLLLEKVPFLVAALKSVVPQGNGACVTLKDLTGEIPATLHSKVYEEYQSELIPGTVLLLNKVSLFSPSQRRRYLNITTNNVLKLYLQNGKVVANEEAKHSSNPVSADDTPHTCNPQDNLLDSVELFNTDVSQEWCGFLDTTSATTTTVVTGPSTSACVSNSTIPPVVTAANSHVVTHTHHDSFTSNNRGNSVQDHMTASSLPQFTDGLEDEDLDSLLRDFEEDHLCT